MTSIDIHSASSLSMAFSDQLPSSENAKETCDSISRSTSVSADTIDDVAVESIIETSAPADSPSLPFARTSSRSVPRLNTKRSASEAPLPWKIDETSSPYTPTQRKASFVPPPRSGIRGSVDNSNSNTKPDLIYASSAPSYAYSSPHSTTNSISGSHIVDLSHPPGYIQNAHAAFSDRTQILSYDNSTPFYQNSHSSYSSGMSSPITPTRRGRGILDNDPSLYLRGEADTDEETYWDTATRWAKAAGKRMSQGEQQLWKMVSAVTNGEDRYDR